MDVLPGEKITRFIRYDSHFDEPDIVRHEVFLPHRKKTDISVFRISQLTDSEVWKIGFGYVQKPELPVYARADLFASNVYENNLKIIPTTKDHKWHADITGFPVEREEHKTEDRKLRRSIARQLALASKLEIPPKQS
jgi:hypothetical protein